MSAGSCPYCQAHAQPGVAYCSSCGQPLAAGGAGPQPWQQPAPYAAPVPQPEPQPQPQQPAPQINPMATVIAARAIDMAQLFAQILSQPFPGWRAEAVAPPGPSTGGGKQALQHLSLIAPSGGRLAIGQVRWTDNAASLRTHAVVDAMHRQRFGQPLPVDAATYAAFLDRISLFLRGGGVAVALDHQPPVSPGPAPGTGASASSAWVWVVVLAFALCVVSALAVVLWLRR